MLPVKSIQNFDEANVEVMLLELRKDVIIGLRIEHNGV